MEQADALPFWQQDYTQLSSGSFRGSVESVSMRNLQVFRETMNRAVDEQAYAPQGTYVVGVPCLVQGESLWNNLHMPLDAVITLDVGTTLSFRTAEVSEIMAASIRSNIIEAYAETVEEVDWRALLRARASVEPVPAAQAERMRSRFANALNSVGAQQEQLLECGPSGYSQFELDILALCVDAMMGTRDHRAVRQSKVQRYIVDRVRDCILERPDDPPSIGELCLMLRISRRTLNQTFQHALGANPVTYARNVRLNRVRRELLHATPQQGNVSQIATRWGFDHMGRFSSHYRALFGELPSATLMRDARSSADAPAVDPLTSLLVIAP
ncbi:helix-turn-helix domain-containing protein [Bordetella genomosp. 12]|uniref:helix-turn-helix domain-containing protein n=1 Tax=Bordetella genomosp. 12 TaxID=463035 RepID=UPI00142E50C3|nr:helix-turn-helix domain-containing protein [Bordetella genomosp. 12]